VRKKTIIEKKKNSTTFRLSALCAVYILIEEVERLHGICAL